jgi:hypothetical protein
LRSLFRPFGPPTSQAMLSRRESAARST